MHLRRSAISVVHSLANAHLAFGRTSITASSGHLRVGVKAKAPTVPNDTTPTPEDKPLEAVRHKLPTDLHPALVPILEDLPKVGPTWHRDAHDLWLETFKAVLDYSYPVREAPGEA